MIRTFVDLIRNKFGDDCFNGAFNIEDRKKVYDLIIDEYKTIGGKNAVDDDDQCTTYLIPIIKGLCQLPRELLEDKILLDHELYVVICNKLSDILIQWNNKQYLNQIESEYFQNTVQLLSIFASWKGVGEKEKIVKLVLDETFIKPIELCITSITKSDYLLLNNKMNNIKNLSTLILIITSFGDGKSLDESHLILLLNSIMNFIFIYYDPDLVFFDLNYHNGANNKILDNNQQENKYTLLSSCVKYFVGYYGKHEDDICQQFIDKLFEKLKQIIEYAGKQIKEWTEKMTDRISLNVINVLIKFCYCQNYLSIVSQDDIIIESIMNIICNLNLHEQVKLESDGFASSFIQKISSLLFKMIKDNEKLLIMLKSNKIIKDNIMDFSESWGYNVSLVICQILTDDEIKNIFDIKPVAKSIAHFLINYTEGENAQYFSDDILNFLTALTALVVHEQARKGFVRIGGLEPLVKCTIMNYEYDPCDIKQKKKVNPKIIRSCSLNLLWALACDKTLASAIRFMRRDIIEHLQDKIDEENKTIANNIIWELEEKHEIIDKKNIDEESEENTQQQAPRKNQYDLMISYCHADKTLCHYLFDRLSQHGYNVWIDKSEMTGQIQDAIAHGIENSDIVLLCVSNSYKQSSWCQSEASYSRDRNKICIPLKVQPDYEPDGWLGISVSGLKYINFSDEESFDMRFDELKREINKQCDAIKNKLPTSIDQNNNNSDSPSTEQDVIVQTDHVKRKLNCSATSFLTSSTTTSFQMISSYPAKSNESYKNLDIHLWSEDEVTKFLNDYHLYPLTLLSNCLDGNTLCEIYKIHETDPKLTKISLENDLKDLHQIYCLPNTIYLKFIANLRYYIQSISPSPGERTNRCVLM